MRWLKAVLILLAIPVWVGGVAILGWIFGDILLRQEMGAESSAAGFIATMATILVMVGAPIAAVEIFLLDDK